MSTYSISGRCALTSRPLEVKITDGRIEQACSIAPTDVGDVWLAPGVYETPVGGCVESHASGRLNLAGTEMLAGAALPLRDDVGWLLRQGLCSLTDAFRMASLHAGALLGMPPPYAEDSPSRLIQFRLDEAARSVTIVGAVGGSMLAQGFGRDAGDTVLYKFNLPRPLSASAIVLRFRVDAGRTSTFRCSGVIQQSVTLLGTGEFATITLSAGSLPAGEHILRMTSAGVAPIALNGFALVEGRDAFAVNFSARPWRPQPAIEAGPNHSVLLKHADLDSWYGFTLGEPATAPELVPWRDLGVTPISTVGRIAIGSGHLGVDSGL